MENLFLGLLAETFIHSGAGSNEGAIDLPVARETATGYPYIPGSGIKGALRELVEQEQEKWLDKAFGKESTGAGGILVGDARLLLLPVRSLCGSYKWLTCPHLLERLNRDMERAGFNTEDLPPLPDEPDDGKVLGKGENIIFLEERTFEFSDPLPATLTERLAPLICHHETKKRLSEQLAVVNNNEFTWFTSYALSVQARNVLKNNKKSDNLWYEESLSPDTLMYCLLGERTADSGLSDFETFIKKKGFFQAGGNETVGQGWFGVAVYKGGKQ